MPARTFLACVGTRPEIIKMARLHRVLGSRGHRVVVLHTGQHEGVAQALYRFFGMLPDKQLALRREADSLAALTAELLNGVDAAMREVDPDAVLVQGDTTSALAGALVAYYQRRPVAHIEAGLRTYRRDPFPEEKNRQVIGRLARWHFAPTAQARRNLLREGIEAESIHEVGNTVIDAALWARDCFERREFALHDYAPQSLCAFLERHEGRHIILVTAHRRENWGEPISHIAAAVVDLLARHPDAAVVWPAHPNPALRGDIQKGLHAAGGELRERIELCEPLEYPAMIAVLRRCRFALTDSGGVQEEASALGAPVLVTRNSTERQELVESGGAVIVGTDVREIVDRGSRLLEDDAAHRAMQVGCPFGNGRAAESIAEVLSTERIGDVLTRE